jgi:hypothetical protein
MAGKPERTRVEVKESSTVDVRTFSITVTVPASDFQLTDLLKQRGVIGGLDTELKVAIKGATEKYLKAAETLISGLVSKPGVTPRANSNANGGGKSSEGLSAVTNPTRQT